MLQAVLCELEGVLVDTATARRQALLDALAAVGTPMDEDSYFRVCVGLTPAAAVAAALSVLDAGDDATMTDLVALDAARRFTVLAAPGLSLAPGARELVETLAGRTRLAVVTRASRRESEMMLALAGWDETAVFECVVAAEDSRHAKPHPAPYERALGRLARRRPLAIADAMVVDQGVGVRSAADAGLRCIAVGAGPRECPDASAALQMILSLDAGAARGVALR